MFAACGTPMAVDMFKVHPVLNVGDIIFKIIICHRCLACRLPMWLLRVGGVRGVETLDRVTIHLPGGRERRARDFILQPGVASNLKLTIVN